MICASAVNRLRGHGELEATLRLLREGPLPTVAALGGAAVGAGLELALSCDLRVAHPEVIVQMPPVKLGLNARGGWAYVAGVAGPRGPAVGRARSVWALGRIG